MSVNYYRGRYTHIVEPASGPPIDLSVDSAAMIDTKTQLGYTGPKPKPLGVNSYHLNVQRFTLEHQAEYRYSSGSFEWTSGPALSLSTSGWNFSPGYSWDSLYNEALDRFYKTVRGDLDLSIDIAESRQTLKMLKLSDQLLDVTRTFVKRFGYTKVASNLWLQYQYGIKPLLNSIWGVADELIRIVINKVTKYRARASSRFYPSHAQINAIVGVANFPIASSNIKTSVTIGGNILSDELDLARWTSLNPISIAWELLPFSFVYDWFLNIGGYLRSWESALLYNNKWRGGYVTKLVTGVAHIDWKTSGETSPGYPFWTNWKGTLRNVDLDRQPLGSPPTPVLPSLEVNMGSSRMLSAAALLGQMLGRR